ncbi:MAG: CBS domain-containing protein [Xanthobacteraceae bacterium]|nr:CBS domain-containing protein [Xanthobacteraceae bacterium]
MQTRQIMTQNVITVAPETPVAEAAKVMLDNHISGLPVIADGRLVGIVTEGDFLRREEIGTARKRSKWLQLILGIGRDAEDFVHAHGRTVADVMTRDPVTVNEDTSLQDLVATMENHHVKRLPVMRDGKLVGIVARANLLRAVSTLAREVSGPAASDEDIRARLTKTLMEADWRPAGLHVTVRDGVAHLHGIIIDERARRAAIVAAEGVAGVKAVEDGLMLVDNWSGFYLTPPDAEPGAAAKGG